MTPAITVSTLGQLLLLGLSLRGVSQAEIGGEIGVSQPTIAHYMAGKKRPAYLRRKRALEVYGIALDAWDTPLAEPFRVKLRRSGGFEYGTEPLRRALQAARDAAMTPAA